MRCFLGGHEYAAKAVVEGDAGWDPCFAQQRREMVRLWNHLVRVRVRGKAIGKKKLGQSKSSALV